MMQFSGSHLHLRIRRGTSTPYPHGMMEGTGSLGKMQLPFLEGGGPPADAETPINALPPSSPRSSCQLLLPSQASHHLASILPALLSLGWHRCSWLGPSIGWTTSRRPSQSLGKDY